MPLTERETVKSALRAVLIKNHDHELAFDAIFDLYFTPPETAAAGQAEQDQDSEEDEDSGAAPGARRLRGAGRRRSGSGGAGSGALGAAG